MARKKNHSKEHYMWLVEELKKELKPQNSFLDWLYRVHTGEPEISDNALSEIYRRADEFPMELLTCYQILSDLLRERMRQGSDSYNWYHHVIADGVANISLKEYQSKKLSLLWEDLTHPMPDVRNVAIWKLAKLGKKDTEIKKKLWTARSYSFESDEQTERFQETLAKALNIGNINKKDRK